MIKNVAVEIFVTKTSESIAVENVFLLEQFYIGQMVLYEGRVLDSSHCKFGEYRCHGILHHEQIRAGQIKLDHIHEPSFLFRFAF